MQFLIIAVLSTAITAIPVYLLIKQFAVNSMYLTLLIGLMLIVTGFLQWKKKSEKEVKENSKNAFLLGLGQEFSVIPGVSRSGITTTVLLFEGFTPEKAFKLSFLL